MICLLDTHTFIWAISDTNQLSKNALEMIKSADNIVYVSVLSFWEISLKISIKKFFFDGIIVNDLPDYVKKMGFRILEMKAHEACTFANLQLKDNHKDPFDRMIIWQAITGNMTLISKDKMFVQYIDNGLRLIW
jgi:PIN domain nuclease of toxin-antitoxin system